MKPAWDKLMAEYTDSSTILVGDVDCTADGKSKCEDVGVQGYPTIKYGSPDDLSDYEGGRDFDALKKFAAGLGPMCSPKNIDLCDDAKKAQISEYMKLDSDAREKMISEKETELQELESTFEKFVEGLQEQYQEASDKKDQAVKDIKEGGLGLLKAVHKYEGKAAKSEL